MKFFSDQTHENNLTFEPFDGYTHYRFAILKCRGIGMMFDFMRYERSFFFRRPDVDRLIKAMSSGLRDYNDQHEIALVRYAWAGRNNPPWTYGRLMSDQSLEETDITTLGFDGACLEVSKPPKKLKLESQIDVTGDIATVLNAMWFNKAMPATESMSHQIESWPHAPEEERTIRLATFVNQEAEWKL